MDAKKPAVDIILPSQVVGNTVENGATPAAPAAASDGLQEMPTVTSLLRRKRLSTAKNAEPVASEPQAEAPVAIEAPVLEAAPAAEPELNVSMQMPTSAPADEAPAVTPSRRRAARVVVAEDAPQQNETIEPAKITATPAARELGDPPVFRGTLMIEALSIKKFHSNVCKHKNSSKMKKLDCLGYFSTRFTEIAYFEVAQPGSLIGLLGYGNPQLVTQTPVQTVTADMLPSVFDLLGQGEVFVGAIESLRAEDQSGLAQLGFSQTASLGVFPVLYKKTVLGLWICTSHEVQEIPQGELKTLKKILAGKYSFFSRPLI